MKCTNSIFSVFYDSHFHEFLDVQQWRKINDSNEPTHSLCFVSLFVLGLTKFRSVLFLTIFCPLLQSVVWNRRKGTNLGKGYSLIYIGSLTVWRPFEGKGRAGANWGESRVVTKETPWRSWVIRGMSPKRDSKHQ